MDQPQHGWPQVAHYIHTLHPLKLSLAASGGIGPPEQLYRGVFTLWLWKCTSFQSQPQVPRVGRASPAPFPVSGGNVWGYKAFFPGLSLISLFPMACCCSSSQLHCSSSFLDLPGADVQGCAADRQSIWEWDRGTALGGKEQKVTGSPCAVSVSAHDLSSLKKKLLIKCRLPPEPAWTFLKDSPSYETFPVRIWMAKS